MKTVTAKELRENLSQYLDQVEAGETLILIRRSRIIGRLQPVSQTLASKGFESDSIASKLTS